MSIDRINFDTSDLSKFSNDLNLNGLVRFTKNLEKHFFSEVFVRECITCDTTETHLVIEVKCAWKLSQGVEHFRRTTLSDTGYTSNLLLNILSELQEVNDVLIDIDELALTMQDTTIIIQRIGSLSVLRQYDNIMRVVLNSYNHIVSQIREVPEEIHIPVLTTTEKRKEGNSILSELTNNTSEKDYFSYWGLCYASNFDTIIYDVENSDFIFEDVMFFPQ